ncbi:MAG: UDP-N-acetylmuramate dehydrogenase [Firmicutes bacterium]|nr:UDP-N-acetylmuramate dehydrogenase [Bacillota bacterium]
MMENLPAPQSEGMERASLTENADMSKYTSFKAGGSATALVEVRSTEELKYVLQFVDAEKIPHMVIGNGSNMLFKDSGYDGLVIKLSQQGFDYAKFGDDNTVCVGTALSNGVLAKMLQREGLAGFEFASGIPGSLGGAVFMNAGAYGGEMKDIVKTVKAISPDGREEKVFSAEEMEFSYRHSILEENGYIAVEVTLKLEKGDKDAIAAQMKELLEKRNSKQPVSYPSAGSTFKRPEGYFAGKLIEDAGLKGLTVGGAQVSTLHSGFVINKGGATATDILQLIALVQNTVYDKFGVMLEPEVRIIG